MDAYLTETARRAFKAFNELSPKPGLSGFLLGHKRGQRFIIESVFPLPKGFRPTLESYYCLDRFLEGKIIGFFAFPPVAVIRSNVLQPFACGKLFLGVRSDEIRKLQFEPSIIDYEGRFRMKPVGLQI